MSTAALPLPMERVVRTVMRPPPSWMAVATMMLAVMIPLSGWMVALSNRVAVLEAENSHLSTAAVQIAQLSQKLTDFQNEYERDRIDANVTAARQAR